MQLVVWPAALVVLAALVVVLWRDAARLAGGYLFCLWLVLMMLGLAVAAGETGNRFLYLLLAAVGVMVLAVVVFGVYILIALLLLNARLMMKRERRSLQNRLTLLVALGLMGFVVLSWLVNSTRLPAWAEALWLGLLALLAALLCHVFVFLVSCLLCALLRPAKNKQYIVVLGSGLLNGQVPPLLAGRINCAVAFYKKQATKKRRTAPKLVMSGGQGENESRPEAVAMAEYAVQRGVPPRDILLEAASQNTAQNMAFSRDMIEEDSGGAPVRCIYATSGYHLLRAGIYARRAGLRARGIGARTARYYLPSALLREYIAYLVLHRVRMLVAAAVVFLGGFGVGLLPVVMNWLLRRAAG